MITSMAVRPSALLLVASAMAAAMIASAAGPDTGLPAIEGIEVDNTPVPWQPGKELRLGAFPKHVVINVGPAPNTHPKFLRLATKLEGFDKEWQPGGGEMFVTARFYNAAGDLVTTKQFEVHGDSPGWDGTLGHSTFSHRRETFTAPLDAKTLWVTLTSAGGPTTIGAYVIDDLIVYKLPATKGAPEVVLRSPFLQSSNISLSQAPPGWERDGTRPSMAKIVEIGEEPKRKALAVIDDDPMSHAEWHNTREAGVPVSPNDNILMEWNEMYSIGVSGVQAAYYDSLPPGSYKFRVASLSPFGQPTGEEITLPIRVPLPYWQSSWFWTMVIVFTAGTSAFSIRYITWHKMRRAVARLEQQRALEQERLRIARDIHDDLGARVTEISLLSGVAENAAGFSEQARAEFSRISVKSRELIAALYETVWAVNPEHDNLDAIANYLRQAINNQCANAQIRCRLHVSPLPRDVEVSSRARHNMSMAAKEAMHNIIKYAKASLVTVHISFADGILRVTIQDDGCGFDPSAQPAGNGLVNMKRRLEEIGGSCGIESAPGKGTQVQFQLRLPVGAQSESVMTL